MRRGVRQGCTIAPLLFAVFSSYYYHLLCQRVLASWASRFVTLFADDSHLAWRIQSISDLQFMNRCVVQAFKLFQELGMVVNPEKSAIIVGLRGHAGRQWIRKRQRRSQGRAVLDLGSPGAPLLIPKVSEMTYLGVVVSYGSFEKQTLAHRLKVAAMSRQRLQKILHSSHALSLRCRTSLYLTCVRAPAMYGLYAVGLTQDVMYRLGVFEARHVRALAKSPVHITRESTSALYARLKISTPTQDLQQLVQRRIQVVQHDSARDWFQLQPQFLLEPQSSPTEAPTRPESAALLPVVAPHAVACPTCGVYFPGTRAMRIHHAKEHQASLVNSLQEKPQAWSLIMRWMECPSVVTASALFPTFVVFKKHILNACPVLLQTSMGPAAATVSEGTQQPLLGQSCREAADVPLMNQADTVQFVLSHSWRELLRDPNMCVRLKNWCVKCGQWVSDAGSGIKTHMRKTHPDLWLLKAEAEDRASKVGLIAQSPCKYCGATVKQPRAHLKHCGSVFQASLYALAVAQDHDDRGGRRDGGSARAGGHLSWVGQVQDATTGGDGGAGIHGEVSSPGSQRRLRQGPERLGQAVAGDWGKPSQEAKASSNQEEMGELVKLLSKMVLKLEDENARLRTECGFILYLDTGEHGNRAGVYKHGWMKDGDVALDPLWTIMRWDPEKQQQVESTTESPLRHSKVLELIDCLRRTIPQDCVLQRFHSTRPMAESYESPVLPFLMTIGVRSTQAGQAYDALCDLIGCSALRMRHRRERQDRRFWPPRSRTPACATGRSARIAGSRARPALLGWTQRRSIRGRRRRTPHRGPRARCSCQ